MLCVLIPPSPHAPLCIDSIPSFSLVSPKKKPFLLSRALHVEVMRLVALRVKIRLINIYALL